MAPQAPRAWPPDNGAMNPSSTPVTVVKLGGSLLSAARAKPWLETLAEAERPVVVVPGGGPFADQVRLQQPLLHFDDVAAHHMAVLAMAQTACVMQSWCPRWQLGHTVAELAGLIAQRQPALWCPTVLPDTPASWDITSDSLAAWLASALRADQLVLVKARAARGSTPAAWRDEGLVDAAFAGQAQAFGGTVRLVSHDTAPRAAVA